MQTALTMVLMQLHPCQSLLQTKSSDPSKKHRFPFDRVFGPSSGQEAVFNEVSEFVQSSLDGYNVTLFSYGQTVRPMRASLKLRIRF